MVTPTSTTAFMSGNDQAIRIPSEFRLDADRVTIRKVGNELRIAPVPFTGADVLRLISDDSEGFWHDLEEPDDLPLEELDSCAD